MNSISRCAVGAFLGASFTTASFAQGSGQSYDLSAPVSRAQVVSDLNDWIAAGYRPTEWIWYPDNAIEASRIVAQRRAGGPDQ